MLSTIQRIILLKLLKGGGGTPTTITGNLPLILQNAKAKAISLLKRFGLCVQNGTPTPSAPVDIVCNNGRIVVGNFISNIPDGQGTFITPSELTTNRIYKAFPTDLVVGRSYTVTVTGTNWLILVQKKMPDGTGSANVSGWVTTYDFTPEEGYIYGVAMRKSQDNITPADFNDTLTLDTTDGKPWTVGTPEVLTVRGINLFDKSTMNTGQGYYVNTNGVIVNGYNANRTVWVPCKPNTKYSYWHTGGAGGCRSFAMNKDTIAVNDEASWLKGVPAYCAKDVVNTITTPADAVKLYITAARSNLDPERTFDEQLADLMVVEGEVAEATAYEPYVAPQTASVENLFEVNDYEDEQDVISGSVTRKVRAKILDGTEEWSASSAVSGVYLFYPADMKPCNPPKNGMSTHFKGTSAATASMADMTVKNTYGSGGAAVLCMRFNGKTSVADFKAWLAEQYANGTPVIVLYPLAVETTEQGTPQHLHTTSGTNIVDSTSNVSPVEAEVKYTA